MAWTGTLSDWTRNYTWPESETTEITAAEGWLNSTKQLDGELSAHRVLANGGQSILVSFPKATTQKSINKIVLKITVINGGTQTVETFATYTSNVNQVVEATDDFLFSVWCNFKLDTTNPPTVTIPEYTNVNISNLEASIDNLDKYMVKGVDYVTAGKKSGTILGTKATAEGTIVTASGGYAHAEGYYTKATGGYSHAENNGATASGDSSHAEGLNTTASGMASHAEGNTTTASAEAAHAEGKNAIASGNYSHAGGENSQAIGSGSFATGLSVRANQDYTFSFGRYNLDPGYQRSWIFMIARPNSSYVDNYDGTAIIYCYVIDPDTSEVINNVLGFRVDYSNNDDVIIWYDQQISLWQPQDLPASGYLKIWEGRTVDPTYNVNFQTFQFTSDVFHITEFPAFLSITYDNVDYPQITDLEPHMGFGVQYLETVGNGSQGDRRNARTLDINGNQTLSGKLTLGSDPTSPMDAVTKQYLENSDNVFLATYGVTTFNDISDALARHRSVFCVRSNRVYSLSSLTTTAQDGISYWFESTSTYKLIPSADGFKTETFYVRAKIANSSTATTTWEEGTKELATKEYVDQHSSGVFVAEYGVTTYQEVADAYSNGKYLCCKYTGGYFGSLYTVLSDRFVFTVLGANTSSSYYPIYYVNITSSNVWSQSSTNLQIKPYLTSVVLASANWDSTTLSQSISVSYVTSSNLVQVSPDPTSSDDYINSSILCASQGSGTLTFTCKTVPTNNITVNVVIWN